VPPVPTAANPGVPATHVAPAVPATPAAPVNRGVRPARPALAADGLASETVMPRRPVVGAPVPVTQPGIPMQVAVPTAPPAPALLPAPSVVPPAGPATGLSGGPVAPAPGIGTGVPSRSGGGAGSTNGRPTQDPRDRR
jgi:hypothetical protein